MYHQTSHQLVFWILLKWARRLSLPPPRQTYSVFYEIYSLGVWSCIISFTIYWVTIFLFSFREFVNSATKISNSIECLWILWLWLYWRGPSVDTCKLTWHDIHFCRSGQVWCDASATQVIHNSMPDIIDKWTWLAAFLERDFYICTRIDRHKVCFVGNLENYIEIKRLFPSPKGLCHSFSNILKIQLMYESCLWLQKYLLRITLWCTVFHGDLPSVVIIFVKSSRIGHSVSVF